MPPDLPSSPRRVPPLPGMKGVGCAGFAFLVVAAACVLIPAWVWLAWRIEPGPGEIAILIRKTGADLPSGEIIASQEGQKGIQLAPVLGEGRYFRNPFVWDWEYSKMTDIPAGKLGVQTRLFGKALPPGRIIADDEQTKGVLREVLGPGKYRINPYAYSVEPYDAVQIRPGSIGVITQLEGSDSLNTANLPADKRNGFLVGEGMKGVIPAILEPGTKYLNPFLVNVVEVNLQSQRFELGGADAINFLTMDGFEVVVEGTLEFAIERSKAAILTHRVGDLDDVLKKVILPRARGFSRLEGSKQPATNFIVGETRQKFQNELENHLRETCEPWGVSVKSVLIRNIEVPEEIASVIREREVAVQDAIKFGQQIEQARSEAELERQETLALQKKELVDAETTQIRAVIAAMQEQSVRLTTATQELEVAKIDLEAAAFTAEATLAKATAERDVIRLNNEAQAQVTASQVRAFGDGTTYARYLMFEKIAPQIGTILGHDGPDGIGAIFQAFMPTAAKPAAAPAHGSPPPRPPPSTPPVTPAPVAAPSVVPAPSAPATSVPTVTP